MAATWAAFGVPVYTLYTSYRVALQCRTGMLCSQANSTLKVKLAHTRLPSVGFRNWSRFLALGSQPAGDVSHKPGSRLPLFSASTLDENNWGALAYLPDSVFVHTNLNWPAVTTQRRITIDTHHLCLFPSHVSRNATVCPQNWLVVSWSPPLQSYLWSPGDIYSQRQCCVCVGQIQSRQLTF